MVFKILREKTEKIFWVVLVLNILALVLLVFLIANINKEKDAYLSSRQELNAQLLREKELVSLDVSLKDNADLIEWSNDFFVHKDKSDIAQFMDGIDGIATSSAVTLKVKSILIRSEKDLANQSFEEMDIAFDINGSWGGIIHFVKMMELLPYKVSFDKVFIEKVEKKTTDGKVSGDWNASFSISVLKLLD